VALLVATHLSVCELCRRNVRDMEAMGGAMLSSVEPVAMSEHALRAVLSRLEEKAPESNTPSPAHSDVPVALQPYIGDEFAKARWIAVAPGLAHIPLIARDGVRARLIRAKPGAGVSVRGPTAPCGRCSTTPSTPDTWCGTAVNARGRNAASAARSTRPPPGCGQPCRPTSPWSPGRSSKQPARSADSTRSR